MMMEAITDSLAAVQCDGCVTAAAGSSVTAVTGNTWHYDITPQTLMSDVYFQMQ